MRVSHPDPNGPADRTPIRVGEVFENPVTRERAIVLELAHTNTEGRAAAELARAWLASTAILRWSSDSPHSRGS
jgi:hypothetical protein